ncbi:peroxisomal membrane protein 11A-like [Acanthaster planci]|uniref:Peroxisomal membrane protein 11A-like n=1 Tax=Acanthaster planci TaxID=133434 RepID=A0A8B7ZZZ1_ACAPL|nr:peroxisomal membrane protein 11A-like [Acanthaster planci]
MSQHQQTLLRNFIKFTSYTEGRDKLYRVTQYASRFLLWYYTNYGGPKNTVQTVQNLESAVTTSRKLFRMFRSAEFAQKAMDMLALTDDVQRLLTVIGYSGKALWLLVDHLIWFGKTDIYSVDTKKWSQRSAWCWLIALVSLTLNDLRKIQLLARRAADMQRAGTIKSMQGAELQRDIQKAHLQLIIDASDLLIPLSVLGYVSKGWGALGGVVSSVVAIHVVWNKNVHGQ